MGVWLASLTASLGGFAFGYDTGCINGVKDMSGFRTTFNISEPTPSNETCTSDHSVEAGVTLGLIVSVFSLGGLLGSLVAGVLSDYAGRKVAVMSGTAVYVIGGALQTGAYFIWMVFIGRIISGFGVGVLFMVVPVYIAELASKRLRGRLISLNSLALTLGILTGLVVNVGCSKLSFGWRVSLGLQCLFGIILFAGMAFFPETPRWLVKNHREQQAIEVLRRVGDGSMSNQDLENEFSEIRKAVRLAEHNSFKEKLMLLLNWKVMQRIILGVILQLLNRLAGITVIMYYSVSIFCKIGIAAYITSIAVGSTNFLTTFQAILFVDKVGRKAMLLLGAVGMMVSMSVAATLILVYRIDEEEEDNLVVGYTVAVLVCCFVYSYSATWGPITWVVNSEIHSLQARGVAVSLTSSAFWVGNFINAQVTPVLLASSLQTHGTFFVLVGVHVLALVFVLLTLPETKGESLERIDALFSKPWLKRTNIFYYLKFGCLSTCCPRTGSSDSEEREYSVHNAVAINKGRDFSEEGDSNPVTEETRLLRS